MAPSTTQTRRYAGGYTTKTLRENGFIESLQLRKITGGGNDLSERPHPIFTDSLGYDYLEPIARLALAFLRSAASIY